MADFDEKLNLSVYRDLLGRGGWPDEREDIGLHGIATWEEAEAAAEKHAGTELTWDDFDGTTGTLEGSKVEYYLVDADEEANVPENELDFLAGEDPDEFDRLVQDIRDS